MNKSRIYTRRGDRGETDLLGGARTAKTDARIEAVGELDELSACIGQALACNPDASFGPLLEMVQQDLLDMGAHVACPAATGGAAPAVLPRLPEARITEFERAIDVMEGELGPIRYFILPRGPLAVTSLHLARAVCRRAERRVIALASTDPGEGDAEVVSPAIVQYLNRLSDFLFTCARAAQERAGGSDQRSNPNRS